MSINNYIKKSLKTGEKITQDYLDNIEATLVESTTQINANTTDTNNIKIEIETARNGKTDLNSRISGVESDLSSNTNSITTINSSLSQKTYYFANVATMKASTSLKTGDMAITLGYTVANDGGGGQYIIQSTGSTDNMIIHGITNGLKAKLIINNGQFNLKQIGGVSDGITDNGWLINNAITYASNNKLKLYITNGTYYSTVMMVPKSNCSIICENSEIVISVSGQYACNLYSLTNLSIKGMKLKRTGNVSMSNYCMTLGFTGSNDNTVILENCIVKNTTTPTSAITCITSIQIAENSNPVLKHCEGITSNKDSGLAKYCDGIRVGGLSASKCSPILYNCIGRGGTGLGSMGILVDNMLSDNKVIMYDCIGYGGIGNSSHGISCDDISNVTLYNCAGYGGSGDGCNGLSVFANANVLDNNGTYIGGNSGEVCAGVRINNSKPIFNGSVAKNALCANNGYAWYITELGNPTLNNCIGDMEVETYRAYNLANSNVPITLSSKGKSYIRDIQIQIYTASDTVTLNIGTTPGGNDISSNISMATSSLSDSGFASISLTSASKKIFEKNSIIYVTPSGNLTEYSFVVLVSTYLGNSYNYSLYCKSARGFEANNCTFHSAPFYNTYAMRLLDCVTNVKMNGSRVSIEDSETGSNNAVLSNLALSGSNIINSILNGVTVA